MPTALSLFVAVGHQGQRIVSADGAEWSNLQVGQEGEVYRAAAAGNGRLVAVGSFGGENLLASSTDGVTWAVAKRSGEYKRYVRALGFGTVDGKGLFVAPGGDPVTVGVSNPFVITSPDGGEWGPYTPIKGRNIIRRIAFGAGRFVGVGDRGRRAASVDGVHWDDAPDVKAIDTLVDIAYGPIIGGREKGLFVGVGLNSLRMVSEDGLHWSERQVGEEGEHLNSIVWAGDCFVGIGPQVSYASSDGVKWTRLESKDGPLTATWGKVAGKGVFVGTQWRGRLLRSEDGATWTQVYKSENHFEAVAFCDG